MVRRTVRGRLLLVALGAAVLAVIIVVPPLERWRAPYGYRFPTRVALYLPVWLLGAAVRAAPRRWAPPAWIGVAAALGGVIARDRYEYAQWFGAATVVAWDWLQAGSVAFLIWAWSRPGTETAPRWAGIARAAAGSSFSLYALHVPALIAIAGAASWWFGDAPTRRDPSRPWWVGVAAIGLVLAYAWVVAAFTERRTEAVRRALRDRPGSLSVARATPPT
jgi:peptidoglycan/LPS O-acetylase OafA/YrhL